MATLLSILAAVGGALVLGLSAAVKFYRARAKAEAASRLESEAANAAVERAYQDRLARFKDIDAYHRARAEGLSPTEALRKAEEVEK